MHRGHGFGSRGYHDGAWFWVARLGFMIVVFALLAAGIAYLLRSTRRPLVADSGPAVPSQPVTRLNDSRRDDAAVAHLRLRYAKGEISRDEFLLAAHDLGASVDSVRTEPVSDRASSDLNPPAEP